MNFMKFVSLLVGALCLVLPRNATAEPECSPPDVSRALVEVCGNFSCVAGVVFQHPRYVVVVDAVARLGRGTEVTDLEGNTIQATVYGVDPREDVALLRLDSDPSGAVALLPSPLSVRAGDTLEARSIAQRRDDDPLGSTARTEVLVTSVSDYQIETATSAVEAGAPMIDCKGRLVGIRNFVNGDFTRVAALERLWEALPSSEPFDGRRHFTGGYGIAHQLDGGRFWVGLEGGFAVSLDDRWELPVRFGAKLYAVDASDVAGLTRGGAQLSHEFGVGYRALLSGGFAPVYVVPSVGVATAFEFEWIQLHSQTQLIQSQFLFQPVVRLNLRLSGGDLGYSYRTDGTGDNDAHQVTIGFWF